MCSPKKQYLWNSNEIKTIMVFYFSGTGNSKHVAQQLAQATGESCISITDCMSKDECSFSLSEDERVGFVTPVYFWGLPDIVVRFVNKLTLTGLHHNFIYHVLTFGTTTGQAHYMMQELLKKKGLRLDAKYNVRMVDVWTPIFDVSDHEKCLRKTEEAEKSIAKTTARAAARKAGNFDCLRFPHWLAHWYYLTYGKQRKTKNFHVMNDRCVGCGKCASQCPEQAIECKDGYPVWTKEKCTLCLRCLHHCPRFAIQYGRHTMKHGQFVHPGERRQDA